MTTLSADCPRTDPKDDLFGHAPFAKMLAKSISDYSSNDGLVLALYGPWGSGKSTVLNYVTHYLEQPPDGNLPVVVSFNPWWFSGQENLARTFLGQLQAMLPSKSEKFKEMAALLGDYAENIGDLIDLSGVTGGVAGQVGKVISTFTRREPKDVSALKSKIIDALRKADKRILVLVDDIDRLTPEEVRQLFTVIKALADFPNVIYLLALDRDVAVQAIGQQIGIPGEDYLKKIIQVPFELPPVDRVALQAVMFHRLDEILGDSSGSPFDQSYWEGVFCEGIYPLIQVPRDVVRFTNTLSVTYPAVRGEVNLVDFIALEAIRVFLPRLYDIVRTNSERFSGHIEGDRNAAKIFHQQWEKEIKEAQRASTRTLLEYIFPKIRRNHSRDRLPKWGKDLRACHPDVFQTYFRFTVPSGGVSRSEMMALLLLTPAELGKALIKAMGERRPDGLSKARVLLERLIELVEKDVPDENIQGLIGVLLDIGDSLVAESDKPGLLDIGNASRVTLIVRHLLKRVEKSERQPLLEQSISNGRGMGVQGNLIDALLRSEEDGGVKTLVDAEALEGLKADWLDRLRAQGDQLLQHGQLPFVLGRWMDWGDPTEVREWCKTATTLDGDLLTFLPKFCSQSWSSSAGEPVTRQMRLDPGYLKSYIDTVACTARLRCLQRDGKVPDSAQEMVDLYLQEAETLQSGNNPDSRNAFDD